MQLDQRPPSPAGLRGPGSRTRAGFGNALSVASVLIHPPAPQLSMASARSSLRTHHTLQLPVRPDPRCATSTSSPAQCVRDTLCEIGLPSHCDRRAGSGSAGARPPRCPSVTPSVPDTSDPALEGVLAGSNCLLVSSPDTAFRGAVEWVCVWQWVR